MEKVPDDQCSHCPNPRTLGEYRKTGYCDTCLEEVMKNGWEPKQNGILVKNGIRLLPSGRIRIEDHPNRRTELLLRGNISVDDLDAEEISMGMCKNADGSFPLRRPSVVPKSIYDKMQSKLYEKVHEELRQGLISSVHTIRQLMENPEEESNVRLKAAIYLLERVMGKTPDVVQINQQRPWEMIIEEIDRNPRPRIIEGEVG